MAHVISVECISCGACADTCPVNAIAPRDTKYIVDADTCIDCGACEAGCPGGAIKAEKPDHKRSRASRAGLFS